MRFDGDTWYIEDTDTTREFTGIWGSSSENIYVVGTYDFSDNEYVRDILWGTILNYDGSEWGLVDDVPLMAIPFTGIHGTDADNICIAGKNGTIINYGGDLWRVVTSGTTNDLNSICCGVDDNIISVVSNVRLQ